MESVVTFFSSIATFVLGLSAKPIQDWVTHTFNAKHLKTEKTKEAIKQAFLLTQRLKLIPEMLNQAISSAIFIDNKIDISNIVKANDPEDIDKIINQIKVILEYDVPCSQEIKNELNGLKEHAYCGLKILSRKFNKILIPANTLEDDFITKCGGDPISAVALWQRDTKQKTEKLINDIETTLHDHFSLLEKELLSNKFKIRLNTFINKSKESFNKIKKQLQQKNSEN